MIDNLAMERKVDMQAVKLQKIFFEFLRDFEIPPSSEEESVLPAKKPTPKYYHELVKEMKLNDKKTLYIDFAHIGAYDPTFALREAILSSYYRYLLFSSSPQIRALHAQGHLQPRYGTLPRLCQGQ